MSADLLRLPDSNIFNINKKCLPVMIILLIRYQYNYFLLVPNYVTMYNITIFTKAITMYN